jgi:hypothetical protein
MITKPIPGMGDLRLFKDKEEGCWMLEEAVDIQSYEEYEEALADFNKVTDLQTLSEVFGWDDNPYER